MRTRIRDSLSFSNVVALLALFVALGGSSYAALSIGSRDIKNNAVRSTDIRNNDVRGKDIRRGTVESSDLKNQSLLAEDFKPGQLPAGPQGDPGPRGLTGAQGQPGTSIFSSAIPSGVTVKGAVGGVTKNDGTASTGALFDQVVSFPAPAPADLASNQVNFAAPNAPVAAFVQDDDLSCTGSPSAPTAPPGKVCIYVSFIQPGSVADAARGQSLGSGGLGRLGFEVIVPDNPGTGTKVGFVGSWAYTAP